MMKPGDIFLASVPQADGSHKLRPVLALCQLPGPYGDWLVCGISSQLHQRVEGWDEILDPGTEIDAQTGLHRRSIVRLSFLSVVAKDTIAGGDRPDERSQAHHCACTSRGTSVYTGRMTLPVQQPASPRQAFCAVFADTEAALGSATDAERALAAEAWSAFGPEFADLRVRLGLHHGKAEERGGVHFGPALNRTARLMSSCWAVPAFALATLTSG